MYCYLFPSTLLNFFELNRDLYMTLPGSERLSRRLCTFMSLFSFFFSDKNNSVLKSAFHPNVLFVLAQRFTLPRFHLLTLRCFISAAHPSSCCCLVSRAAGGREMDGVQIKAKNIHQHVSGRQRLLRANSNSMLLNDYTALSVQCTLVQMNPTSGLGANCVHGCFNWGLIMLKYRLNNTFTTLLLRAILLDTI